MTQEIVRGFFGWCGLINLGILLYWFVFIAFATDWVYKMHIRWYKQPYKVTKERFLEIHYTGMLYFKLIIFFFNIVPYGVLWII